MPLRPDRAPVFRNLGRIDPCAQCVSRNIDSVRVRSTERRLIAINNDTVKVLQATG